MPSFARHGRRYGGMTAVWMLVLAVSLMSMAAAQTPDPVTRAAKGAAAQPAVPVKPEPAKPEPARPDAANPEPGALPAPGASVDPSEPTPAHVEAARQLILATGISRSFQVIIPEFMDQIGMTLSQSRPELTNDINAALTTLKPEFDKQADEMINLSARIYARLLTEDDIRAILAFFRSQAGNKYVNAQPLFLNQLVAGMQAWQQKISVNMMARVRDEMKRRGHPL